MLGIVIFPQTLILSCIQGVLLYNTVLALRGESFLSTLAGDKLLTILFGALLVLVGNVLPKCKRNGLVGFRLFSPKGYGMLLLAVYTMAAIVISIVRAWQVYRAEKARERDRG